MGMILGYGICSLCGLFYSAAHTGGHHHSHYYHCCQHHHHYIPVHTALHIHTYHSHLSVIKTTSIWVFTPFDQYCHDRKTLVWDISAPKDQYLNHICSVIPFLLLGIGIDNIFVITQTFNTMGECWCCTRYTYYKKNNLIENSTNQQQKQQHHRQSWPKGLVRPWNTQVGKSPIC